ncbi:MAG: response regulator [Opitutaceae bacterium]
MNPAARPAKLLIVEDDPFYSELTRAAALSCHRFAEVATADGGLAALDLLLAQSAEPSGLPDLVLSDLKMAEIDGLELIEALHEHPALRRIPVVIMTSSEDPRDRAAAARAGCRHFFQKPASVRALADELGQMSAFCGEAAHV